MTTGAVAGRGKGPCPINPTATAIRSGRGTAVPSGRPLCRAAHVGAHARHASAHSTPGRAPGAAHTGTRYCMHASGHTGTRRSAWRCERLPWSGRVCVGLCSRSLVYGALCARGGVPMGERCGCCGGDARRAGVATVPGVAPAGAGTALRVSCMGVGAWVPARLFGARSGAVRHANRWFAKEFLKLFFGDIMPGQTGCSTVIRCGSSKNFPVSGCAVRNGGADWCHHHDGNEEVKPGRTGVEEKNASR